MIEIIATIASLFGMSAKDLLNQFKIFRGKWSKKNLEKRINEELLYLTHSNMCRFVEAFYETDSKISDLRRYKLEVNGKSVETTIFTKNEFLNIKKNPLELPLKLVPGEDKDTSVIPKDFANFALKVAARLEQIGVDIWDAPLYRLVELSELEKHNLFTKINFLDYRFSSGLLLDELTDEIIDSKGQIESLVNSSRTFKLRRKLMPDLDSIINLKSRICCGGIGTVFALRRESDYLIPLHIRSSRVSDGRELLAVLPKAFHQPIIDPDIEVNVFWTLFRELYEELFGGDEAKKDSPYLAHDWYFDSSEGLKWFESNDSYRCEVTSFGYNGIAGNYDYGLLLVIEDPNYEKEYRRSMRKNWELKHTIWVSTINTRKLADMIIEGNWASESLFHFIEGLLRLKEIDPKRVNPPDIERINITNV